jgi:hypothetical protein
LNVSQHYLLIATTCGDLMTTTIHTSNHMHEVQDRRNIL